MKVIGSAVLLIMLAASLACPLGGRGAKGSSSLLSQAGAGQTLRARATRFGVFDGEYLKQKGVNVKMNSTLAALREFGSALNVELFDVAGVPGKVLIADSSVDLSDAFIKALQSKPSAATGLTVPAVKVPTVTVAFVNTEAFGDAQMGITRLAKAFGTVEQEFSPRREEVKKLREEAAAASGERKRKLEAEAVRKQEAGQAALDKRLKALTGPVYEDIGSALVAFCKQHGITLIFDISKMESDETLPPFGVPLPSDAPDITREFISAYNQGALKP
jgi:Skp family chaperone for outer membrane proteins